MDMDKGVEVDSAGCLYCPACGGENLHHEGITVFSRDGERARPHHCREHKQ